MVKTIVRKFVKLIITSYRMDTLGYGFYMKKNK